MASLFRPVGDGYGDGYGDDGGDGGGSVSNSRRIRRKEKK